MAHSKVNARISEVQEQLSRLGYPHFPITFEVKRIKPGVSGRAFLNSSHIEFSSDYLREHEEQMLQRTVAHEVAHLYVKQYHPRAKQCHGPEFRKIMTLLGCDPSTYHTMKLVDGPKKQTRTKTRYVYQTEAGVIAHLTKNQHEKVLAGVSKFSIQGHRLTYAGYTEVYK